MSSIYTVTGETQGTVDANLADTTYIVAEGASITAPGTALFGNSDAADRKFIVNGNLNANIGVMVGNDYTQPSDMHITVGATGLIKTAFYGILSKGNDAVITNHGEIDSAWGIEAYGKNLAIGNTGTIKVDTYGIDIGGADAKVTNSGTIDAGNGIAVSINCTYGDTSTFVNTGTISGSAYAVTTYYGNDTVINKGTINGEVELFYGNDVYEGKNGAIHGLIDGSYGNDHLKGGSQFDRLSGGADHDVLTGRGGADLFVFSTNFDADKITDFKAFGKGHDQIDLGEMKGFDNFADLKGHMHEVGKDAVLNFGHGDVLTLDNVDFHDLSKADFLF